MLDQNLISHAFAAEVSEEARLVLLVISCNANSDGVTSKIKDEELISMSRAGLKPKELSSVITELKTKGYIEREQGRYLLKFDA